MSGAFFSPAHYAIRNEFLRRVALYHDLAHYRRQSPHRISDIAAYASGFIGSLGFAGAFAFIAPGRLADRSISFKFAFRLSRSVVPLRCFLIRPIIILL
jgi:hypothetical protein